MSPPSWTKQTVLTHQKQYDVPTVPRLPLPKGSRVVSTPKDLVRLLRQDEQPNATASRASDLGRNQPPIASIAGHIVPGTRKSRRPRGPRNCVLFGPGRSAGSDPFLLRPSVLTMHTLTSNESTHTQTMIHTASLADFPIPGRVSSMPSTILH